MIQRFLRPAALAAALGLAACSASQTSGGMSVLPSSGSSSGSSSTTRHIQDSFGHPNMSMDVNLYDAPLPLQGDVHVYLAIAGLDVVSGLTAQPLATFATPQTVDLLTLQQSAFPMSGSLPAGTYNALRLLVAPAGSSVVVNGQVYPMVFRGKAHGHQAAIVALDSDVLVSGTPGESVSIDADFNVLESITLRGGFAYVTPKIVVADRPARLAGRVVNANGAAVSNATVVAYDQNGSAVNSSLTRDDGTFTIHAVRAGSYRIKVLNTYVTRSGDTVVAEGATSTTGPTASIVVAPSDVLDLGTLSD
jgi:Carboxypeptidase regulatory-like domain/Domain of unknown function (DUF4382)